MVSYASLRRHAAVPVSVFLLLLLLTVPASADVSVSSFTDLNNAVNTGGTQVILITEDIDMSAIRIPDGADITLKPSGKSVTLSFAGLTSLDHTSSFVKIPKGSNLTLSGSDSFTLSISGSLNSENAAVLIFNKGNLTVNDGVIIQNHNGAERYSGIQNNGCFIMNGGLITACTGKTGGAVSVTDASGSFVMNGGQITGNHADEGSGLFLSNGCTFQMNGGSISQNTGYDIAVRGGNPSRTSITLSQDAEISGIHFQNILSGASASVPVMQIEPGFIGAVHGISYDYFVPDTPFAQFSSAAEAVSVQEQFSPASGKYQVSVDGNHLFLSVKPAALLVSDVPSAVTVPGNEIRIPVSLEVTGTPVSSFVITASLLDAGQKVSGVSYTYAVKKPSPFSASSTTSDGTLTLSTGKDITADIDELFILTAGNTEGLSTGDYTLRFVMESSVSNQEDYTVYPTQTLDVPVSVIPIILATTSNTQGPDIFGYERWSFTHKASVTYVISPHSTSLGVPWPTVSRNATPAYSSAVSELAAVSVYKSAEPYGGSNTWIAASSSVFRNDDGTVRFQISDADADAKCFKLVFTGRKLGDVVEGSGDIDTVNLYDVDMILHAAVDMYRYIKPEWRVYADVDSDGQIQLSDALYVFNFITGN